MKMTEPLIRPRAVLFDMDGTLTEPMLDFPLIKREMGIGDRPSLESLKQMSEADRLRAENVLHRHEEHAAENSSLNPGCRELLAWLHDRAINVALVTRNTRRSVRTVLRRHALNIDVLITREDAPQKPDPQALLLACQQLRVPADQAWMIGDGQYDIEAALAVPMRSVWVSHGPDKPFAAVPWQSVANLPELTALLARCTHDNGSTVS